MGEEWDCMACMLGDGIVPIAPGCCMLMGTPSMVGACTRMERGRTSSLSGAASEILNSSLAPLTTPLLAMMKAFAAGEPPLSPLALNTSQNTVHHSYRNPCGAAI